MISTHSVASSKHWLFGLLLLLVLNLISASAQAAKPKLAVSKAAWSAKLNTLTIKGTLKNAAGHAPIEILDSNGRRLALATGDSFNLSLKGQDLPSIPCTVRAQSGSLETLVKVGGAPKSCASPAPTCQILSPANGATLQAHQAISFQAKTLQKNKKAGPLKIEWDFAGGVMQTTAQRMSTQPVGSHHTEATFVRDNSRYRVRFIATDSLNRRCEDSIDIAVGNPPDSKNEFQTTLATVNSMAANSQAEAPKLGQSGAASTSGVVVMPFDDWSMQSFSDSAMMPLGVMMQSPPLHNINAEVYRKGLKPTALAPDEVKLSYKAASNQADSVSSAAINSTSQNWPLSAWLQDALVQKTDIMGMMPQDGDPNTQLPSYVLTQSTANAIPSRLDEGVIINKLSPNAEHGQYMPGIDNPFVSNDLQAFNVFDETLKRFSAPGLPLADVDDNGRINPRPLYRIQADDVQSTLSAITDVAMNAGRDFHCRECHGKGGLAANAYTKRPSSQTGSPEALGFYDAGSSSLFDQEVAADKNLVLLHQNRGGADFSGSLEENKGLMTCYTSCHASNRIVDTGMDNIGMSADFLSRDTHKLHAQLQYDPAKNDILHLANGFPDKWQPAEGETVNKLSLFPTKDPKTGAMLPMEQNCLKCHGGQREQCYRDRMYTAGVTCYQCHGSLEAMGGLFTKSQFKRDGFDRRRPWMEQPECASCHTGNGNQNPTNNADFYTAGVMKTAFDESDPSATARIPDLSNPDQARFALPLSQSSMPSMPGMPDMPGMDGVGAQTLLFRQGKDSHGQVGCPACHGAAHAIWPNRDPSANENVTALQLQGHAGSIDDCNVCHSQDGFAKFDGLDGALLRGDSKPGILGGPHNMHPVNDTNWWKQATGSKSKSDDPNSDGSTSGGWHNDYAKIAGEANEDQCAACHGNDHKGTRLSKTPVDRVFDFSKAPDWKLLKKTGIKSTISVKAGTPIGCDLCHSIEKSCTGSPNAHCGQTSDQGTSATNQPPVITSTPPAPVMVNQAYAYQVTANDPDGDPVSYRLEQENLKKGMHDYWGSIDQNGLVTIGSGYFATGVGGGLHDFLDYRVIVTDSKGGYSVQTVHQSIDCPTGLLKNAGSCQAIFFTSASDNMAVDTGQAIDFSYLAQAVQSTGLPISYRLNDVPADMTISQTGLIDWHSAGRSETVGFSVSAFDNQGHEARQPIYIYVCQAPEVANSEHTMCYNPGASQLVLMPDPSVPGLNAGDSLSYQMSAWDSQGLGVTYSLGNNPQGVGIDTASGLVTLASVPAVDALTFEVIAQNSQGTEARQTVRLTVCRPPNYWDVNTYQCLGPISISSYLDQYWLDPGQTFSYQAQAVTTPNAYPLSFELGLAPAGMTIDGNGLLTWDAPPLAGTYNFEIWVSDTQGGRVNQSLFLIVCSAPNHFDGNTGLCKGPVSIADPQQALGVDAGQLFTYQVQVNNLNNSALSYYLLNDSLVGMTIDSNGLISWLAYPNDSPLADVVVRDSLGNQDNRSFQLQVCVPPQTWSGGYCQSPQLQAATVKSASSKINQNQKKAVVKKP